MKNRFELIVFDWDGTLIDTIDWIVSCLQQSALECQFPIPGQDAAKDTIGLSIDQAFQKLFPGIDTKTQKKLINSYNNAFFLKKLSRKDLFAGVFDMLMQLQHRGLHLAVATGKGRAGLQQALAATGTEDLFVITRCADETASKPSPMMLHEIMAQTGVAKEKTLMVGDSIHDMQMALNAGVSAAAVACGAHSEDTLMQLNPLACLQQTAELVEMI